MSNPTIVIDVLTVATLRIPAPKTWERFSPQQIKAFAEQQLAQASQEDLKASIDEIDLLPDQISIEREDQPNEVLFTTPAYRAFIEHPVNTEKDLQNRQALIDSRRRAAENALANYDFSSHGEFESSTGWEWYEQNGQPEDRMECAVFLEPEKEATTRRYTFVVQFKPGTSEVEEAYVN